MKENLKVNDVLFGGLALILIVALICAIVALGGWITMILWNLVVPALGGAKIGFWMGVGINLLARWLFGRSTKE